MVVGVNARRGGLHLLFGLEQKPGLRWSDVAVESGRVSLAAVRAALPCHRTVGVLSGIKRGGEIADSALLAVVDAGRRGGATVVCDLPRRLTPASEAAMDSADLVVTIGSC